jgi:myo-inositol 2-dehydrogenase / D-chiro-inositol 1-dehydrogenase
MANDERRELTRRTFLMGTLASLAVPALSTTSTLLAGKHNDAMLMGCIGVGRMGRGDMQEMIYQGLDANARVVAVCDLDTKRLAQAKELVEQIYTKEAEKAGPYAGCATYGDYRELLGRKDIDGVLIATPDHWHALAAVDAAKARKDIYVEKPMTYSIREGQQLVRAVRKNRCVLQVGSQQRSSIYFRKACELVRNGRIGELRTIRVGLPEDKETGDPTTSPVPPNLNYDTWMGPSAVAPYAEERVHPQNGFGRPGWLQIERYCLGMITGWGAHMNDIAQWGNGSERTGIVEIEAEGKFPQRGLFDVHTWFHAEGRYANGVKLIQETGEPGVRFEGDEGWIFVSRKKLEASDPELLKGKIKSGGVKLYESKNHMANFLECMRTRKDPVAPVEVGHRSNIICIITHISMKLGRKLRWDPKTESFRNDEEANAMLDYAHRAPWTIG